MFPASAFWCNAICFFRKLWRQIDISLMVRLYQAVVCLISLSVFQGAVGLPGCSAGYSKVFTNWILQFVCGWYYQCHAVSCWKRGCLGLAEWIFDHKIGNNRKIQSFWPVCLLLRAVHRSSAHLACQEIVPQTVSQIATDLARLSFPGALG